MPDARDDLMQAARDLAGAIGPTEAAVLQAVRAIAAFNAAQGRYLAAVRQGQTPELGATEAGELEAVGRRLGAVTQIFRQLFGNTN